MLDINYPYDESPDNIVDIISRCQKYDYNNLVVAYLIITFP